VAEERYDATSLKLMAVKHRARVVVGEGVNFAVGLYPSPFKLICTIVWVPGEVSHLVIVLNFSGTV